MNNLRHVFMGSGRHSSYQHKTDPGEMRAERITVDGKTVELR